MATPGTAPVLQGTVAAAAAGTHPVPTARTGMAAKEVAAVAAVQAAILTVVVVAAAVAVSAVAVAVAVVVSPMPGLGRRRSR